MTAFSDIQYPVCTEIYVKTSEYSNRIVRIIINGCTPSAAERNSIFTFLIFY